MDYRDSNRPDVSGPRAPDKTRMASRDGAGSTTVQQTGAATPAEFWQALQVIGFTRIIDTMPPNTPFEAESLRSEIAIAAARMIAEDGADYGSAKRRAAKQILGDVKVRGDHLPDNAQIELEVRAHQALFFGDTQPARLLHLRRLAAELMDQLAPFWPYLTGAVLNGTAGEHSDIHLQLFAESSKDVAVYLMDRNIQFEVSESAHFKGRSEPVETLSFLWKREGVHLALYDVDDLRGALKSGAGGKTERLPLQGLVALIAATVPDSDIESNS